MNLVNLSSNGATDYDRAASVVSDSDKLVDFKRKTIKAWCRYSLKEQDKQVLEVLLLKRGKLYKTQCAIGGNYKKCKVHAMTKIDVDIKDLIDGREKLEEIIDKKDDQGVDTYKDRKTLDELNEQIKKRTNNHVEKA